MKTASLPALFIIPVLLPSTADRIITRYHDDGWIISCNVMKETYTVRVDSTLKGHTHREVMTINSPEYFSNYSERKYSEPEIAEITSSGDTLFSMEILVGPGQYDDGHYYRTVQFSM